MRTGEECMFDSFMETLRGFIPNGGDSVYSNPSSNGLGVDVIVKDAFGKVTQTLQGLDQSQANDIISNILGR